MSGWLSPPILLEWRALPICPEFPVSVRYVVSSRLPTPWAVFEMHGFEDVENSKEHVVLTLGDVANGESVLCRLHSECLTGDALFSMRCDCGSQLEAALQKIASEGRGALLYLRQEGRGIGLMNKIRAYKLQDAGADTVEANEQLGFRDDEREYREAAEMLLKLGFSQVRLMTNNPRKLEALGKHGVTVVERVAHSFPANDHNQRYLWTKANRSGHLF